MASGVMEKTEEELRKEHFELNPQQRQAERNDAEDQPAPKKRISSAVVKIEEGEIAEDVSGAPMEANKEDSAVEASTREAPANQNERKPSNWLWRDGYQRLSKMDFDIPPQEPVPRVLPKNEDPKFVSRNKRMLGQLWGPWRYSKNGKLQGERNCRETRKTLLNKMLQRLRKNGKIF